MTKIETRLGNLSGVCPWGEGRGEGRGGKEKPEARSQVTAQKPEAPQPGSRAPGLRTVPTWGRQDPCLLSSHPEVV